MVEYIGVRKLNGYMNAMVYRVGTASGDVFMSFKGSEEEAQTRVAIVDASVFLNLWRASPYALHADIANGNPRTWKKDYKYTDAENGFREGFDNPVPLGLVSYENTPHKGIWTKLVSRNIVPGSVSFTDGITRTIWLLSNGAKSFPIEVSDGQAVKLSNIAKMVS